MNLDNEEPIHGAHQLKGLRRRWQTYRIQCLMCWSLYMRTVMLEKPYDGNSPCLARVLLVLQMPVDHLQIGKSLNRQLNSFCRKQPQPL